MNSFNLATALELPELPTHLTKVDHTTKAALETDNPYLRTPVERLLATRGKRLRPSLVIAVAISHGKAIDEAVISGCAAVELLHIASLIHDDIIDNADIRWGVPTLNRQEGVDCAIVVGDYLIARAYEQAAIAGAAVARTVATAFASLCDGQSRELADIGNLSRTQTSYLHAINGKTAALFAASCKIGAICAGLSDAQVRAFGLFGASFGMAFQIVDDVLDLVSAPELSGKPAGTDVNEGVYTLPLILTLASEQAEAAKSLLERKATPQLIDLLLQNSTVQTALARAREYIQTAKNTLAPVGQQTTDALANFPDTYIQWALTNLVAPAYKDTLAKE